MQQKQELAVLLLIFSIIGFLGWMIIGKPALAEEPQPTLKVEDLQKAWTEMEDAQQTLHKAAEFLRQHPTAMNVDLDKLALAVSAKETCSCTCGVAISHNNCYGLGGVGHFIDFQTKEDSTVFFKNMWLTRYGDRLPTLADAARYDPPDPQSWLDDVLHFYNN